MQALSQCCCLCLLWWFSTSAWAVYQCHDQGQVIYRDLPCVGVQARDFSGMPVDETLARERLRDDRTLLQRLVRDRQAQEKKEAVLNQQAQRRTTRRQAAAQRQIKKCMLLAQRQQWALEDAQTAPHGQWEKARRKSRLASARYAAQCPA